MATLMVSRPRQWIGLLGAMKIVVDGQAIAKLSRGSVATIEVDAGSHAIVASYLGSKSEPLEISLSPDETAELEALFAWGRAEDMILVLKRTEPTRSAADPDRERI